MEAGLANSLNLKNPEVFNVVSIPQAVLGRLDSVQGFQAGARRFS